MIRRGFVDSPDGQIHYVTSGSGDPVIFLHPSPHSWNFFTRAIPVIAQRFQFIGMDTMGYGDSARPPKPYTEMIEYARSVTWLMDGLGLEKASVVGHLTGSEIATEVGAAFPERVDKLVLSEVFNWDKPSRRAVHENIHRIVEAKPDGSHLLEMWNKYANRGAMNLETVQLLFLNLYKVNLGPQPVETYGHMGWDGSAPWVMCHYPFWDRVGLIKAPTLVLHAEAGELLRIQSKMLEKIERSKGKLCPSSNRGGPLDHDSAWSHIVTEYLLNPGV